MHCGCNNSGFGLERLVRVVSKEEECGRRSNSKVDLRS